MAAVFSYPVRVILVKWKTTNIANCYWSMVPCHISGIRYLRRSKPTCLSIRLGWCPAGDINRPFSRYRAYTMAGLRFYVPADGIGPP